MTNWQTKKIGDLLTIRHGRNQRDVESSNGKYPILGTGGQIGRATKPLYSKPSVLIGRKGTIDKPRYMSTPFWTVDTLFYSEVRPENNAKFMYYVFETIDWRRYNEASGVPSLSASTISTIKVNVPEKSEQERIVGGLEVWDECIERLERRIALKEQLKKGLMQQLLTGKRRLSGFGDAWRTMRIGEIVYIKKGSGLSKEQLADNGSECVLYGEIYTKYDEIIDEVVSKTTSNDGVTSRANDVLVPASTTTSSLDVATATCILKDNVLLGGDINILRPKIDMNGKFLALLLSQPEKINLAKRAQGITIVHLYGKDIAKMKVNLPDRVEQDEIVKVFECIRSEIKSLTRLLEALKLQKKYLLKNLITGTIRMPENLTRKGAVS